MIHYETLSLKNRKDIVFTIWFFLSLAALWGGLGYFFCTMVGNSSGQVGGSVVILYRILAYFGWQPQGLTARDFGYLFAISVCALGVVYSLYKMVLCFMDYRYNQQAYMEGELLEKHIKIVSGKKKDSNKMDKYGITFMDVAGNTHFKQIEPSQHHNFLVGDIIRFVFAPHSQYVFSVDVVSRTKEVMTEVPISSMQYVDYEPFTQEELAKHNKGYGIFYFPIGFSIIFMSILTIVVKILREQKEDPPPAPIWILFGVAYVFMIYIFVDLVKKRYRYYKDFKSGFKKVTVGTILSKNTVASNGRDACQVTLKLQGSEDIKTFTIPPSVFDTVVPNNTLMVKHLERTLQVFECVILR